MRWSGVIDAVKRGDIGGFPGAAAKRVHKAADGSEVRLPDMRNKQNQEWGRTQEAAFDTRAAKEPKISPSSRIETPPPGRPGSFDERMRSAGQQHLQNQAQAPAVRAGLFEGFSDSVQGGMSHIMAGSLLGGVASYATGGEFGQGMAMGGATAFSVRGMHRSLGQNHKMWNDRAKAYAGSGKRGSERMSKMLDNIAEKGNAHSMHTMNQRKAMYMGAGLMGVMGGGDRKSHKRGFNSHRGNGF